METIAEKSSRMHVTPCADIKEIMSWLNGNGKPGAKTRLILLETDISEIKSDIKSVKTAAWGLVVAVLLSSVTFFLFQVIPHIGGG